MPWMIHNPAERQVYRGLALLLACGPPLCAQLAPQAHTAVPAPQASATAPQGTVLDRVIAVVNGDAILESDVNEEMRFVKIQPFSYRAAGEATRERALQRLIDRTLIQQEADRQPGLEVTDEELDRQLAELRKDIPECKEYQCETEAGWQKFLAKYNFTPAQFRDRWRTRMELLRFIQIRFGSGIRITDEQIKDYYDKTMLPEYQRQKVTPPGLDTVIRRRIEEVLLQQQVGNLLRDWLASLRAQGSVRIIGQDEVGR